MNSMTEVQRDLVLHLLREGDWQEAIIAYAEEAGVTQFEATEAVHALAASNNIRKKSLGWFTLAAFASFVSLAAGWIIARPF